jgi:hypothetical protein
MAKNIITGLVSRDDRLQWTSVLIGTKGEVSIVERSGPGNGTGKAPEKDGEVGSEEAPQLDELLLQESARLKGALHFAMPAEKALIRVMDLPTVDDEEIDGMVELQLDKVCPYPVDHMYVSWERLQETEHGCRVLVAAAKRQYLDQIGQAADEASLVLHRTDVDVLCWIDLMRASGEIPEHGRHILVLADKSATHLVVFDHQSPVLFQSLGESSSDGDAELMQAVAEELEYTMTSLENEWGVVEYVTCSVWHWNNAPSGLDQLEQVLECQIHTRNLSSLPELSEGVTNRAVRAGDGLVDIAPKGWKQAEELRRLRKNVFIGAGAVMGIWLIGLIGFFIWVSMTQGDLDKLKGKLAATEKPASEVKDLQRRVLELSQYTNRTYSALECFREVIETMPAGVELTDLTYDKSQGVQLRGESRIRNNLDLLIKGLTESDLFIAVEDVSIDGPKLRATVKIPYGGDDS